MAAVEKLDQLDRHIRLFPPSSLFCGGFQDKTLPEDGKTAPAGLLGAGGRR